jgi:hypothetical protein
MKRLDHIVPLDIARRLIKHLKPTDGNPRGVVKLGGRTGTTLSIALSATFILYLGMISPGRLGALYDDCIYVTAAKSLATGQGYQVISLPHPVPQTLIPPLYPFMLSLIWRIYPKFPQNVTWMMLFSAIGTVSFFALAWRYLVHQGYAKPWVALAAVTIAAVNWHIMLLGSSVMAEVVFAPLSVCALCLAEKHDGKGHAWVGGIGLGILIGLVSLTRTSGLPLLVAVAAFYVLRGRWRRGLLPIAIATIFVVAWFAWVRVNGSELKGEHAAYYAGYAQGISQTLTNLALLNGTSRLMVLLKVIKTNVYGMILIWAPLRYLGSGWVARVAVLIPFAFATLALLGFVRHARRGLRLLHVYVVIYVVLHLVVPGFSYDRYLMPILPFLLIFFVKELLRVATTMRTTLSVDGRLADKAAAALLGVILCALGGFALYDNSYQIYWAQTSLKRSAAVSGDWETIEWIKANTDPSEVLLSYADFKYYLYTDRPSVRSISASRLGARVYQDRSAARAQLTKAFDNIVRENRARYLILNPTDFYYGAPDYGTAIESEIAEHPERFVLVFESGDGSNRVFRIE